MYKLLLVMLFLFIGCDDDAQGPIENNDGSLIIVSLQDSDSVAIVGNNLDVEVQIPIVLMDMMGMGEAPHDVAVDNTHGYWFTSAMMGGSIGMYSIETNELISSFTIGHMPALLTLDEINKLIYVSRGMNEFNTGNIIYELSYANNILTEVEQWNVEFDYAHGIEFDKISGNVYVISKTNDYIAKINPNEPQIPFSNPMIVSMDNTYNNNHTIAVNRLRPIEITTKYPYMFITCSAGEWSSEDQYEEIPGQIQMWHMEDMNLLASIEFSTYSRPWHIEASPIEDKVFITLAGGNEDQNSESGVICIEYSESDNQVTMSKSWETTSSDYGTMHGITIHSDCHGNYYVYTTGRTDGDIYKFDASTGEQIAIKNLVSSGSVRTGGIDSYSPPCDTCCD
jgi:hypothetical protein